MARDATDSTTVESRDELVDAARAHLTAAHPGRAYTRDQILFFADE